MSRTLGLLLFVSFLTPVSAQVSASADQTQLIEKLLHRIDALEKRVSELEATQHEHSEAANEVHGVKAQPAATSAIASSASHSTSAVPNAKPERQVAMVHTAGRDEQVPVVEQQFPSLKIVGFGDVDFGATDEKGSHPGFEIGQFTLHFSSALSKRVSFFGETTFSARPTGYLVEVERSFLRYDYNDAFKLSFGRYHTPISYWNTAFHHGAWLQTTIDRPEIVRIGGRFIPVHFVGGLAEGSLPGGPLGIGYNAGVGNGRGEIISRPGDAGDVNNNKAWLATLFSRPPAFPALQFGGSIYEDMITPTPNLNVRERITSAHLVWTRENPEFLSEFANVHHEDLRTGHVSDSQGFYVQVADRLPWFQQKWKPYYRFERIHTPLGEPVLDMPSDYRSILGVRFDIIDYSALKLEYRNTKIHAERRVNGVFAQTAFTF